MKRISLGDSIARVENLGDSSARIIEEDLGDSMTGPLVQEDSDSMAEIAKDNVLCKSDKPKEFLVNLKPGQIIRQYQQELAEPGLQGKNYIFVAPTGSGKTLVSATIIARHLTKIPNSRVAFIVPTKPLADQQMFRLKEYIPNACVNVYTGGELGSALSTEPPNMRESNDHISVCTAGKLHEEILQKRVKFSQFSMLVLDECHHTVKEHVYAKLMKLYLEERQSLQDFQVIGMTASLGAGNRSNISDHIKNLQAHLDATGGIVSVKNPSKLGKFNKEPSRTLQVLQPRDRADEFISEVVASMKVLENFVKTFQDCEYERWSQEYETFVIKRKEALEASTNEAYRDQISTLNELLKFCSALSVYMDFTKMDAIRTMKGMSDIPDDDSATDHEQNLRTEKEDLLTKLRKIPETENPLLIGIESILEQKFRSNRLSRAIVFVRTKNHTIALKKWLSGRGNLREIGIVSDLITGYTGMGDEMTRERQINVLKKFSEGSINVLVATSVAEEGLDIPDCNLVIRYQHVSSDIAKIQAEGRARADDSDCYTVLSTSNNFKSQEVKNQGLILQVVHFMNSLVQTGRDEIRSLQSKLLSEERTKKILQENRKIHLASSITMICKKCKKEVCSGEDISLLAEDEAHHVVPEDKIRNQFIRQANNEQIWISRSLLLTEKMTCAGCRNKWGHVCYSTESNQKYCLFSCRGFTFKIDGHPTTHLGKTWSEVPFHIRSTQ